MTQAHDRSPSATATSTSPPEGDVYHVMFGQNDIRKMTLDQVDDCFRLGVISERTYLWTEGMAAWETLAEAAGLSEPARTPPPVPRDKPRKPERTATVRPPPPSRRKNATSGERPVANAGQLPPPPSTPASGTVRASTQSRAPVAGGSVPSDTGPGHLRALPPSQSAPSASRNPYIPPTPAQAVLTAQASSVRASIVQTSLTGYSGPTGQSSTLSDYNTAGHANTPYAAAPANEAPQNASSGGSAAAPQYAAPQAYAAAPQYAAPQHAAPQAYAAAPQYAAPQYVAPQAYAAPPQYAAPQYPAPQAYSGAQQHAAPQAYAGGNAAQAVYQQAQTYPQTQGYQSSSYSDAPPPYSMVAPTRTQPVVPSAPKQVAWGSPLPGAAMPGNVGWGNAAVAPLSANAFISDVSSADVFSRPRGSMGTRFQRGVFWLCLLGGAGTIAYRNDYVLQLARASHNERLFLSLEQRWFGGAPSGIPRQVKALLGLGDDAATNGGAAAKTDIPTIRLGPLPSASTASSLGAQAAPTTAGPDAPLVARVEEPVEKPTESGENASKAPAPMMRTTAGVSSERPSRAVSTPSSKSESSFASDSRSESSSVSSFPPRRSATEIAEMKRRHWEKAVSRPDTSAEEAPRAREERRVKSEPAPEPGSDDFLHMSIRESVKDGKKKKAAKSKMDKHGSKEYDPLNGEI